MRPPMIVIASLGAIAVTGTFFAMTSLFGGAAAVAALFLLLPVSAAACYRVRRYSRTALFIASLAAIAPLMVGLLLTWPQLDSGFPYLAGIGALVGGLAGMLTPAARAWHATESAHRLLDL
ncbi:MAG: hypothetical protein U5K74_00520 [Gemmatimonadaceae bacterium]|nr:hypothetical protein [Gemmatimonadaceae bacterium]